MNGYGFPVFASTHPAVSQLFDREFAIRRAVEQSDQAQLAAELERQRIAAQREMAQAQLRAAQAQTEQANLFRMENLRQQQSAQEDYRKLKGRELDIAEKSGRLSTAEEARKQAIIDTNARAKTAAQRFQNAYEANLSKALDDISSKEWWGKAARRQELENAKDPERMQTETDIWNRTLRDLRADPDISLIIPDFKSKVFRPVQLDEKGNPLLDTESTPRKPTYSPVPSAGPVVITPDDIDRANLFGVSRTPSQFSFEEMRRRAEVETAAGAPVATMPKVRRPYGQLTILLSPEDDLELARQVASVPPEQRTATYAAIVDQLLKSGRAVYERPATTPSFNPGGLPIQYAPRGTAAGSVPFPP